LGLVFVLEVLVAGCVAVALLPFGCAVVVAGAVVLPGFAVVVVGFADVDGVVVFDGVALVVLPGCVGVLVEAGVDEGVIGAMGSFGPGNGLDVMLAINSLRPVSVLLFRYL
jgi:hypothetical protein